MAELDIAGILRELSEGGVDFFLIGGVAVGYHGHVRATKDVDVVPSPEKTNLERLAAALDRLDAQVDGAEDFDPAELPNPLDPKALATGGNWVLTTRLGRLDIMQWIGERPLWAEMSAGAIEDEIVGMRIKIAANSRRRLPATESSFKLSELENAVSQLLGRVTNERVAA